MNKHFPKSNPLHKLVNQNWLQNNIKHTETHIYTKTENLKKLWKFCQKTQLKGKCLVDNVVYRAKVETNKEKQTYVGLCSTTFKDGIRNHKSSFKNSKFRTTLARHVCELKEKNSLNIKKSHLKWILILPCGIQFIAVCLILEFV